MTLPSLEAWKIAQTPITSLLEVAVVAKKVIDDANGVVQAFSIVDASRRCRFITYTGWAPDVGGCGGGGRMGGVFAPRPTKAANCWVILSC